MWEALPHTKAVYGWFSTTLSSRCSPGAVWWSLVSHNPARGCCRELGSTPGVRAWAQENVQSLNAKEKQFCCHCCLLNIYKNKIFVLLFSYMRFQPLCHCWPSPSVPIARPHAGSSKEDRGSLASPAHCSNLGGKKVLKAWERVRAAHGILQDWRSPFMEGHISRLPGGEEAIWQGAGHGSHFRALKRQYHCTVLGREAFPVQESTFFLFLTPFFCHRSAAGILLLKATPTVDKADQKLLQAKWVQRSPPFWASCSSLRISPSVLRMQERFSELSAASQAWWSMYTCAGGRHLLVGQRHARTSSKGLVAWLGAKPSPSPVHGAVLFLVQPCFLKGRWDHNVVLSLLEEGLTENISVRTRWMCHTLSVGCKSKEHQLRDQHRGNTSAASGPQGKQKHWQQLKCVKSYKHRF